MTKSSFNPDKDIPNLAGKVILVTGGTAGLGKESLLALAKHNPGHLYFTGRNEKSAEEVVSAIKAIAPDAPVTFLKCDLADLSSIKAGAQKFLAAEKRLDIVIANAGIMAVPPATTKDGYEVQFGTNHVGHAALLKLLLPTMEATAAQPNSESRLVILTSLGYRGHPPGGIIFDTLKTDQNKITPVLAGWVRYGQSKLANLLYAQELARHHPSITAVAVHPGVINTGIVTSLGFANKAFVWVMNLGRFMTLAEGAFNRVWAATVDKTNLENGAYYEPLGVKKTPIRDGTDKELAKKLWDWTEEELKNFRIN